MIRQQRAAWVDHRGRAWVVEECDTFAYMEVSYRGHLATRFCPFDLNHIEDFARTAIASLDKHMPLFQRPRPVTAALLTTDEPIKALDDEAKAAKRLDMRGVGRARKAMRDRVHAELRAYVEAKARAKG